MSRVLKAKSCPKKCGLAFSAQDKETLAALMAEHDRVVHPAKKEIRRGR